MGDPIEVPDFTSARFDLSIDGVIISSTMKSITWVGRNIPFDDIQTAAIEYTASGNPMMLRIDSPGGVLNGMRDLIGTMRGNSASGVGSVGSWKAWTVPSKPARVTRTAHNHLPKRIQGRLRSLKQRGKR